jgi:hypothetical protein
LTDEHRKTCILRSPGRQLDTRKLKEKGKGSQK